MRRRLLQRRRRTTGSVGYTMVEVMMALAILTIAASGIVAMQKATLVGNMKSRNLATASQVAQAWMSRGPLLRQAPSPMGPALPWGARVTMGDPSDVPLQSTQSHEARGHKGSVETRVPEGFPIAEVLCLSARRPPQQPYAIPRPTLA